MSAASDGSSPLSLGIIGCGNMGSSFARGVLNEPNLTAAFPLTVFDSFAPSAQRLVEQGARAAESTAALARASDIILLAVKPHQVGSLLQEIAPHLGEAGQPATKLLISIAAGVNLEFLHAIVGGRCPIIRVMPNTFAVVGQGLFGVCYDTHTPQPSQLHRDVTRRLFSALGSVIEIEENRMNAFTALAGGGPAYVFYFMESLAEAGVSVGLTRDHSVAIAHALIKGGAALAEQSGSHSAVLREMVCSPGGTTIAAINHLDRSAVKGHVVDAIRAAAKRGREMEEEA